MDTIDICGSSNVGNVGSTVRPLEIELRRCTSQLRRLNWDYSVVLLITQLR